MSESVAKRLARLSADKRSAILSQLTPFEQGLLYYSPEFMLRPEQQIPTKGFRLALVLAGRGFGKTKLGGYWVRRKAETGRAKFGALIGPDEGEIRKYMVEGPSGIRKACPPWYQPEWYSSKGGMKLVWPDGTIVECHSAEEPQYRGPNLDFAWWDEPAKCRWLPILWANLKRTLRGSGHGMDPPQVLMTGTPLPLQFFRDLKKNPKTYFVTGSTLDNADNLDKEYLDDMVQQGDSREAQQERDGVLLEDEKGQMFVQTTIDKYRIKRLEDVPRRFLRIVVSIDPADSVSGRSDETGIVVEGLDANEHLFVLEEKTEKALPDVWAENAYRFYEKWAPSADKIEFVAESNKGGENVRAVLLMWQRNEWLKKHHGSDKGFKPVDVTMFRSTVSKAERAHPVSQLYGAGRVHHVGWSLGRLEQEMTSWIPGVTKKSPNGLDALCQGAHHMLDLGKPIEPDNASLMSGMGQESNLMLTETSETSAQLDTLFGPREEWRRTL
jgi:phage terminase large subunit-like protein